MFQGLVRAALKPLLCCEGATKEAWMLDFLKGFFTALAVAAIIRLGAEVLFEQAGLYM